MFVPGGHGNQPFFVFIIEDVMVRQVLEHSQPTIIIEVWQFVGRCRNGGKAIVKDDVELRCDIPGLRIQNEGNGAGVLVREPEVGPNVALGDVVVMVSADTSK